jgi:hypothetical protein
MRARRPAWPHAVQLPLANYEPAAEPIDRFVVAPGHEDPTVEVVVEEHESYIVVSKPDLKRMRSS